MHSSSYRRSFVFVQGNSFPFTLPLSPNRLSLLGINIRTDLCSRSFSVRALFVQWAGQVGVRVRRFTRTVLRACGPSLESVPSGTSALSAFFGLLGVHVRPSCISRGVLLRLGVPGLVMVAWCAVSRVRDMRVSVMFVITRGYACPCDSRRHAWGPHVPANSVLAAFVRLNRTERALVDSGSICQVAR